MKKIYIFYKILFLVMILFYICKLYQIFLFDV